MKKTIVKSNEPKLKLQKIVIAMLTPEDMRKIVGGNQRMEPNSGSPSTRPECDTVTSNQHNDAVAMP
ncbi:MAG TPA: class I lanthipeptide [Chitinophaga sp.]|uniref:class I lanthipeptide n=1 Tax=Chitinophaga sp. TaxID=1869181 RepID=UPI002BE7956C|nr:class I lanthipeptide [Chitinophaga sp.]HVI45997.1 class I lanthipeptide [Chitinophaga sp.]